MKKIDYITLQSLEDLLEMESGYVLDFSNNSFQRFIKNVIDIDIYYDKGYEDYCSKANKLRQIFDTEPVAKVSHLVNALVDYTENNKLKNNNFTDYDKKIISDIRHKVKKFNVNRSDMKYIINKDLDALFKKISTREASFINMSLDEKLKEIGNLIEYLLKREGKYISLDFEDITLNFIVDSDVKRLKKGLQCFRHSTDKSLKERERFTKYQKDFMVEYGIVICSSIYNHLKP